MRANNVIKQRLQGYEKAYKEAVKNNQYAAMRRLAYKINELRWVIQKPPLNQENQWRKQNG